MKSKEHGGRNKNQVCGHEYGKWIVNLNRLVKVGSLQKLAFKQTCKRGEKALTITSWGRLLQVEGITSVQAPMWEYCWYVLPTE